jgi:transposase
MDVVYSHVCGLDVHKKNVVACVLTPETKEIRTFSTMTEDLLSLLDWIKQHGCTHVAMESTGSFWKPVYNLLEMEGIQTLVVNAKHIKNVPGRKTDVKDAEWIAGLLRHGLLKGSFIPNREQRELRELIRYRRSLIEERAREANRMQKVLEGANIKLSSVASDILGKSGHAMLEAMIAGENDAMVLSALAQKRLKNKKQELIKALNGLIGPHQRLMLKAQLRHIDDLDILTIVYHLLKRKQTYIELGPHFYDDRKRHHVVKQAIRKLEALGLTVTVEERNQTA